MKLKLRVKRLAIISNKQYILYNLLDNENEKKRFFKKPKAELGHINKYFSPNYEARSRAKEFIISLLQVRYLFITRKDLFITSKLSCYCM